MKTCSKCKTPKPVGRFCADRRARDGLQSQCEDCRSEAKKAAYRRDPAKVYARVVAWRTGHPDRIQAQRRRQYAENRQAIIDRAVAWQRNNPERRAEIASHYKHRRRAQELRSTDVPPTVELLRRRDGDLCYLCGFAVDFTASFPDPLYPSVDHCLPLSRSGAHSMENAGLAHHLCNVRKQARTPEEDLG